MNKQDFIGVYDNAFSKEYCLNIINYFNIMQEKGFTKNRKFWNIDKIKMNDDALFAHDCNLINLDSAGFLPEFNKIFWEYYKKYAEDFSILNNVSNHGSYTFKVQKTEVGGGYHEWHCEADKRSNCNRILVWSLYLNDVEEGGETEFLYQHKRVKSKQGRLIIFPAAFTHTHRGNPPLSNDKYIITGWVEF